MAKRLLDIVVSFSLLLASAPILLILMLWIKLDSVGPALYRQQRVGMNGRVFNIYKLRTMVADADKRGGHSTVAGDPRITKSGAFLRRTSLDELPQLLNVIRGEMSLVGPRPDTPMQEGDYTPGDWRLRNSVRPGLTGLAQARVRSAATKEERLALDLSYVERATFGHDLAILWETAVALFIRRTV